MPSGGKKVTKTGLRKKGKTSKDVREKPLSPPRSSGTDSSSEDEPIPAAQSSGLSLDSSLKEAIQHQIALSLRSPDLVKRIADDIFDVIAEKLEERVTAKVYAAVNMDIKKHDDDLEAIRQKMTTMKKDIEKLSDDKDDAEQYSRRNCLRIYGLGEKANENTDKLVLDLFNDKLGLNVPADAIDRSHRITPRQKPEEDNVAHRGRDQSASYADVTRTRKPRSIIVKFSRYNARDKIYKARTRLKDLRGPKVFIREDLTANKAELYWKVVSSKKAKTCWTQDGTIYALKQDGRKIRIKNENDIESL